MNNSKKSKSGMFKFLMAAAIVFAVVSLLVTFLTTRNAAGQTEPVNLEEMELVQLDILEGKIEDGTPIATITTSFGDIKAVLFPEYAPETVARFTELAKEGYYDGTYVFNIEPDVFCAAGSADKEGALKEGYDEEKEKLPIEYHDNLWPLKGSICSYGLAKRSILGKTTLYGGSRFVAVNSIKLTDEEKAELRAVNEEDTRVADAFIKYGGVPNFSRQMTVFAQAYEGIELIEKICSQEVGTEDDNKNIPVSDIIIEKIEISEYKK